MPRTNLYLIKGFLRIYRKRLFTLNCFSQQNTKTCEYCQNSSFQYISFYSVHHGQGFLINTMLANADRLTAGLGQSSGTAVADDMLIPSWNCILYLDQKLSSVGYTEICRSTARKWEAGLG